MTDQNNFNKETFSKILKSAIGTNRTITEFSNECNVARPYISKFLNCKLDTPPSPETISKMASASRNNISEADLLVAAGYTTYDEHIDSTLENFTESGDIFNTTIHFKMEMRLKYADCLLNISPKKVPVLYDVTSTSMSTNENLHLHYYQYIGEVNPDSQGYYLYANDNSMKASGINSESMVYFIPQDYAENNDLVVVLINGTSYIRRYRKINNIITFNSDDSSYDSFAYLNSEFKKSDVNIIGKITHCKIAF